MSVIKPFKAVFYNKEKVKDVAKVMAPPYDIITEEAQIEFLNSSPYHFTHIDFNQSRPGDNEKENKYTRAKVTFDKWLQDEILRRDDQDCIYFYKQEYTIMGQKHSRTGFIALLQLDDNKESKVKPHEKTHQDAVDDRFKLTESLEANLSCIFVCYSDFQRKVDQIFNKNVLSTEPFFDVIGPDGVRHILWRLGNPDHIKDIQSSVFGQNLFIADGHHRYKTACDYRDRRKATDPNFNEDSPYNYVMTYFTNLDSRDLQIFPMHRVLREFPEDMSFLENYFRIDKVSNKDDLPILLAKAGLNEHAFGLYTREGVWLLRLRNKLLIDEHIKDGSKDYRHLDATILKSFVFDQLGVESGEIVYTKDIPESMRMVDKKEAEALFVMNPVKISELKAIALNGERMPPKTTYFYPKVLSGLTVYHMV